MIYWTSFEGISLCAQLPPSAACTSNAGGRAAIRVRTLRHRPLVDIANGVRGGVGAFSVYANGPAFANFELLRQPYISPCTRRHRIGVRARPSGTGARPPRPTVG